MLSLAPLAGVSCGRISLMDDVLARIVPIGNGVYTDPPFGDMGVTGGDDPYCSALEI